MGAAIQGGILAGDVEEEMVLLDVTPLSLGVETLGGVMTRLIERNTTIPTEKKEVFSTAADNQSEVTVHVLQGEREFASDNRTLGQFNLTGIPPAPRGIPQIEVTFAIDANGILNVTAKDLGTGKEQSIEIKGSSGLEKDEIDRMKKDADEHAEDDRKRRELVDLKNQGDALAYNVEKMLNEAGEGISGEDRGNIESSVSALKETLKGDDPEAIRRAVQNVEQASHKISEAMYKKAADERAAEAEQGQAAEGETAKEDGDDDVIDADFEVKE
jgi:molecular chaperone DnaK